MVGAAPVWASALPPLLLPCGEVRLDPAALPEFRARLEASSRPAPTSVGESPAETGGASRPGEPKGDDGHQAAVSDGPVYVLQYDADETPSSAVRRAVAASGATLLSPVSGAAYLVRASAAQCLAVLDAGVVAAAREYRAEDKIAAGLSGGLETASPLSGDIPVRTLVVSVFSDCDPAAACEAVATVSVCEVLDVSGSALRVRAAASAIHPVASLPGVESIGPWLEPTLDAF